MTDYKILTLVNVTMKHCGSLYQNEVTTLYIFENITNNLPKWNKYTMEIYKCKKYYK